MNNRNILIIEKKLNPTTGGVQRVSHIIGEEFRAMGHNVWYAFYDNDTDIIEEKYKVIYNPLLSEIEIYLKFKSFIEINKIDTLIVQNIHSSRMYTVFDKLKKDLSLQIICCLHVSPDLFINKNSWKLTLPSIYGKDLLKSAYRVFIKNSYLIELRRAYKLSNRYVLLSEKFIPIFKRVSNIKDTSKLRGINNPITFTKSSFDTGTEKEKILLVVGRMYENQKRISNVLMVWRQLQSKFSDWRLVIVGDGPDLNRYKKMSSDWNLQRIEFSGHSDNVKEYYASASIFLMTSIWEGFGMTLIEAQSYGCVPVVFDNFAALHDIINGENGIIVKSNDLDSYISEVAGLMSDERKLRRMAEVARRTSMSDFSREKIMEEWSMLLNELDYEMER